MSSVAPVMLYALSTCLFCKKTKRLLDDCAVQYLAIDVDLLGDQEKDAALAEMNRYNPRASFPTIIVGDVVIVGFRESEIKKAVETLAHGR